MFIITHPYTSDNYKRFYNKAIIIYDDVAKTYHKFDPATNTYSTPNPSECKADYFHFFSISLNTLVQSTRYYNGQCTSYAFSTIEEATLAKLYLLNALAAQISADIAYLQAKFAEACLPELSTAYDSMKLNYPEIFI